MSQDANSIIANFDVSSSSSSMPVPVDSIRHSSSTSSFINSKSLSVIDRSSSRILAIYNDRKRQREQGTDPNVFSRRPPPGELHSFGEPCRSVRSTTKRIRNPCLFPFPKGHTKKSRTGGRDSEVIAALERIKEARLNPYEGG